MTLSGSEFFNAHIYHRKPFSPHITMHKVHVRVSNADVSIAIDFNLEQTNTTQPNRPRNAIAPRKPEHTFSIKVVSCFSECSCVVYVFRTWPIVHCACDSLCMRHTNAVTMVSGTTAGCCCCCCCRLSDFGKQTDVAHNRRRRRVLETLPHHHLAVR